MIKSCDNSRFANYWNKIGTTFLDTADNVTFKIIAVCKSGGAYFYRYFPADDKAATADNIEHTPVKELLNADWYQPIGDDESSEDESEKQAKRKYKKKSHK